MILRLLTIIILTVGPIVYGFACLLAQIGLVR